MMIPPKKFKTISLGKKNKSEDIRPGQPIRVNWLGIRNRLYWCTMNGICNGHFGRVHGIKHNSPKEYILIFVGITGAVMDTFKRNEFEIANSSAVKLLGWKKDNSKKNKRNKLSHAAVKDILPPTPDELFEKISFYIVPFWYVPIGIHLRWENEWWYKKSSTQAQTEKGYSVCYPRVNELVVIFKDHFEEKRDKHVKVDCILEEFEVLCNSPY